MLALETCLIYVSVQGVLNELQLLTDDAPASSPSVNAYFDSLLGAALH